MLPVMGMVSPANALWIADQVRNDKLLLRVLSSYPKSAKKPAKSRSIGLFDDVEQGLPTSAALVSP